MRTVAALSTPQPSRQGMTILIALAALVLSGLLLLAAVRTAVGEYRAIRHQERQSQAAWLASSGVERALASLAADQNYQGETWVVDATSLTGRYGAEVEIAVQPVTDRPDARQIVVRADFPAAAVDRARESRQLVVELSSTGATP